jgi:hypothetical protein
MILLPLSPTGPVGPGQLLSQLLETCDFDDFDGLVIALEHSD